jgi:hypothetical protein
VLQCTEHRTRFKIEGSNAHKLIHRIIERWCKRQLFVVTVVVGRKGDCGGLHWMNNMLSKRRCPHTGVVNFFFATDPHLAVGSVVKASQSGFVWRCYADPCAAGGAAADMKTAERRVTEQCRLAARHERAHLVEAA